MSPSASELKMAKMLVEDMSGEWDPEQYKDEFKAAVMGLVEKKARAGKTETVIEPQEESPAYADNVIDLTELLQRSLKGGRAGAKAPAAARKSTAAARKTAARKAPASKTPAKAAKSGAKPAGKTAAKAAAKTRKAA
ncbi:hypothetical protein D3C72_1701770 [compost metagenome]